MPTPGPHFESIFETVFARSFSIELAVFASVGGTKIPPAKEPTQAGA